MIWNFYLVTTRSSVHVYICHKILPFLPGAKFSNILLLLITHYFYNILPYTLSCFIMLVTITCADFSSCQITVAPSRLFRIPHSGEIFADFLDRELGSKWSIWQVMIRVPPFLMLEPFKILFREEKYETRAVRNNADGRVNDWDEANWSQQCTTTKAPINRVVNTAQSCN